VLKKEFFKLWQQLGHHVRHRTVKRQMVPNNQNARESLKEVNDL